MGGWVHAQGEEAAENGLREFPKLRAGSCGHHEENMGRKEWGKGRKRLMEGEEPAAPPHCFLLLSPSLFTPTHPSSQPPTHPHAHTHTRTHTQMQVWAHQGKSVPTPRVTWPDSREESPLCRSPPFEGGSYVATASYVLHLAFLGLPRRPE